MTPSPVCFALIKQSEGLRLTYYRDTGGVATVGWGHTGPDVKKKITYDEAEQLLEGDVNEAADCVTRLAGKCTQGQFDALTDFVFNVGEGKFATSSLLRFHKAGNYTAAAAEFAKWKYDNGKTEPGLIKRRAAETHVYLSDTLPPSAAAA